MSLDKYNNKISIEEAECRLNWKTEQIKARNKMKEGTSKTSPKKPILWIRQPKQVKQQSTTSIQILMLTYHNGVR